MRAAGGQLTSLAVPTIADSHHGVTREQLRASVPSLADRESAEAMTDAIIKAHGIRASLIDDTDGRGLLATKGGG